MNVKPKRAKLETQLRNVEIKLAHKRDVMARHAEGTAWYTRARREADGCEHRITDLRRRIAQC